MPVCNLLLIYFLLCLNYTSEKKKLFFLRKENNRNNCHTRVKNTFNIYSSILLSQMQRCATYDSIAGITKNLNPLSLVKP